MKMKLVPLRFGFETHSNKGSYKWKHAFNDRYDLKPASVNWPKEDDLLYFCESVNQLVTITLFNLRCQLHCSTSTSKCSNGMDITLVKRKIRVFLPDFFTPMLQNSGFTAENTVNMISMFIHVHDTY